MEIRWIEMEEDKVVGGCCGQWSCRELRGTYAALSARVLQATQLGGAADGWVCKLIKGHSGLWLRKNDL